MVTKSRSLPGEIATKEDFDFEAPKEYLANNVTPVFGHTHIAVYYQLLDSQCPVNSIHLEIKDVQERLLVYPFW